MLQNDFKMSEGKPVLQTPPTALDLDRNVGGAPSNVDMLDMMADMCPVCNGNCMRVGDWVCYGFCSHCMYDAMRGGT